MADDTDPARKSLPERGDDMPFRFLDLSPEMRNHVYSHATESEGRKLSYLGLTQVCRQVRNEFRPIYMNETNTEMYGNEIANYLDVFHSEWAKDHMSQDKASTLMVITRWRLGALSVDGHPSIRNFVWHWETVKLLPKSLPRQGAEIIESCCERAKVAIQGRGFSSGPIYCEITHSVTTYYFDLGLVSGMAFKDLLVLPTDSAILEWLGTEDVIAIMEPERGSREERSIWFGFEISIDWNSATSLVCNHLYGATAELLVSWQA